MRKAKFVGMLLALFVCNFASAQGPGAAAPAGAAVSATLSSDPRLDEIQASSKAFVDAFNKGDATSIADMWSETGEYVDAGGNVFVGREAIKQAYADFFQNNAGAKLQLNTDSLKTISDTTAIEHGTTTTTLPSAATIAGRHETIHVKVDGKWKMALVREAVDTSMIATQNLGDLEFLVGNWVAEEQGNRTESVCKWVSNHSFVKREYTTTYFDGSKASGVQMIGWNPQGGHVQSWSFSPDGGHATGMWLPTQDGWSAEMRGTTGAGVATTSVNLLRRLDDNAYVWQSVQRTVDGVSVANTDEVVIKRQP